MEYLDLYDRHYHNTSKTILRGSKIPDNYFIKVVVVYIENSEHKFLFQMTSKEKGSIYATTGGHVKSGSNPLSTIQEEVLEELGVLIPKSHFKHLLRTRKFGRILDTYYLKADLDINDLKLQKEEVAAVKWFSKNELEELSKQENIRKSNFDIMRKVGLL